MKAGILARRIIQDAHEYSSVIVHLLKNTEEQHELAANARWEAELNQDPHQLIVHEVPMPPHMQSIEVERVIICTELMHGPLDERHLSVRIVRIVTLQAYLADWLVGEVLKDDEVCAYLHGRNYTFGVGARWRMLVVEKLPKLLPKPK